MKEILENKEKDIREKSEQFVIAILEKELIEMEKRKPVLRRKGKGDPKYEILFKFAQESKKMVLKWPMKRLKTKKNTPIITRLENRLYHLDVSRGSEEQFQLLKALLKKWKKSFMGLFWMKMEKSRLILKKNLNRNENWQKILNQKNKKLNLNKIRCDFIPKP